MKRLVQTREFYFDITTQKTYKLGVYDDGLFNQYDIAISPSVLFLFPDGRREFLDHTTLFGAQISTEEAAIPKASKQNCAEAVREAVHADRVAR